MKLVQLAAGALLLLAFALWTSGSLALGGGKDDKDKVDDKSAIYTVVIKSVSVQTTNADGGAWDVMDGKPDLAVIVRNLTDKDSDSYATKTKDDVFQAEYNEPTPIKAKAGDTLEFQVVDKDVAVNDEIGKTHLKLEGKHVKDDLRFEKFGRVLQFAISIKKL